MPKSRKRRPKNRLPKTTFPSEFYEIQKTAPFQVRFFNVCYYMVERLSRICAYF